MAGAKLNPLLQKVALVRDDDFYMGLDDIAFRTCVQEKAHHSLEIQVCHAEHTGCEMFPQRPALVEHLLELWDCRGLSHELPEYRFARRLVDMANDYLNGRPIDLSSYAPRRLTPEEADRFDKILYGRRSVRAFDMERDVPDEMIDRLIDAALWAPNGGNMQPCRFLVIREKKRAGTVPRERYSRRSGAHCHCCGYAGKPRHGTAAPRDRPAGRAAAVAPQYAAQLRCCRTEHCAGGPRARPVGRMADLCRGND